MNKFTIIGDIHGRIVWKDIVAQESDSDQIIFLGDYLDSYELLTANEEFANFMEILEYRNAHPDKVVLLIGNHDLHYISGIVRGSRYSAKIQKLVEPLILDLIENDTLQTVKYFENIDAWFVHAGITKTWLEDSQLTLNEKGINNYLKTNPERFGFITKSYSNPYGDDVFQSPLWVRPDSLLQDLPSKSKQVVGHTQINHPEFKTYDGVSFCDSLEWRKYYVFEKNQDTSDWNYSMKQI
jgi:predicted MPP superfamily phosphohydrolase